MSNKPSTEIRVDLLLDFLAQHYFPTRNKTEMIASWEAFKASHSSVGEGRDWEIFELKDGTEFSALVDGDYWLKKQAVKITAKGISDAGMIKSVRRLSDGEVFSVGELIGVSQMTLVRFEIIKGGLYAYCAPAGKLPIFELKKAPIPEPKKPLFTTEDGRPAYKGDVVYLLCFESWSLTQVVAAHSPLVGHEKEYKYFSTEKSAIEFIVMNRAVFSLKDIMNELVSETTGRSTLLWKEKNKLTQLAKSKINKDGGV